ncbi:MAG: hypothetical protein Q7S01_01870 [bacterium]|nr:hypothetical protein [bacterium]
MKRSLCTRGFIPLIPLVIAALIIACAGYIAVKNNSDRATEQGSGNEDTRDAIESSDPQTNARQESGKRSMNLIDIERQIDTARRSGGISPGAYAWLLEQISLLEKQALDPQKIAELRATLAKISIVTPTAQTSPTQTATELPPRRELPAP